MVDANSTILEKPGSEALPELLSMKAWQCIGCGRLEGPAPCLGICEDRPVELVYAADYREALAKAERLAQLVRRIAWSTPREGELERSWRALQAQARKLLSA